MADKTYLVELHWQNRSNFQETIFVDQEEFSEADECTHWAMEKCIERGQEMPFGWCPMLVLPNQESK